LQAHSKSYGCLHTFGSDTRRLRLDATADFKALVSALRPLFLPADSATQHTVTWTDEGGDVVTVAGDPDFIEAKRAHVQRGGSVVRFTIVAATPPPCPSTTMAGPVAALTAPSAPTATLAPKSVKFTFDAAKYAFDATTVTGDATSALRLRGVALSARFFDHVCLQRALMPVP
jgi:hypothetical protein